MMAPPPNSSETRAAPASQVRSSTTAKEKCEKYKPAPVPGTVGWGKESKPLNAWGKKSGATRSISAGRNALGSAAETVRAAGIADPSETTVGSEKRPSADVSDSSNTSASAVKSKASYAGCSSAPADTKPSEMSVQQKADVKQDSHTSTGELSLNQLGNSLVLKSASETKSASEAGSLTTSELTPSTSTAKEDPNTAAAIAAATGDSPPEDPHEELLRNLKPLDDKVDIDKHTAASSNNVANNTTDSSNNSNIDNCCTEKCIDTLSGVPETLSPSEKCDFFAADSGGTAALETLAAKLRYFSFNKPMESSNGPAMNSTNTVSGRGAHSSTTTDFNSGSGGHLCEGDSNPLLNHGNNLKSSQIVSGDAASNGATFSNSQINPVKQLKETLYPAHKNNIILSTVLRDSAYTSATLGTTDMTAADVAFPFPLEYTRQQQNTRDCAFDRAPGASAIAAAAVLAQQESRPLLLTRFEMLEAYAKGRLCLSCDSKSHRMPSCPYGEFVCPNCHRSSHRGEECPLRCRFCQTLHVGISVTVCIKRFRGPLEALLGIPLPLRDLQPASLLSSGSPLSPFGPAACTRPNSAFGRSIYLSNLPPNTTQEAVAAAVESLVTKGRILQVDLHEKHAFVQLSTLEAAFELVDKRRQLQIRGVTLKVQFKKTGVFNNALPQGGATGAGAFGAAGVMHSSGSNNSNSGFGLPTAGCGSNTSAGGATHSSASTPLSAASSSPPAAGGTLNVETPKISPSLNSLVIFLGPPTAPFVSEICAQVAAKLREDLQLGLVSAQQQPQQSFMNSTPLGMQQLGGDGLQLKQHLQTRPFEEPLTTPLTRSLLNMSGSHSRINLSALADKDLGPGAANATGASALAAAGGSREGVTSGLLPYGLTQNKSLGSDNLQRRQLPYSMDAAAASAAALLQQQQLLALSRQQQQQQQKQPAALSTEKILLQLLQRQQLEQQQQLAQQQHRYAAFGQREDDSSSSTTSPTQDFLLTETLMRAAAAAAAERCIQTAPDQNNSEAFGPRQHLQLQLRQQEQLQDMQQRQQRQQQRLMQLACPPEGALFEAAAAQEQQLHQQRTRQPADLRDFMGLPHYPVYPEALGKPITSDSLVALGLASSQGEASGHPYVGMLGGSGSGVCTKGGGNTTVLPTSTTCTTNPASGLDLQLLLSEKSKYNNDLSSTSAASMQGCYSRADATPAHSTIKSTGTSSTEGSVAFASLQHPWNDLAAAAAAAVPTSAKTGRLGPGSTTSVSSHAQPLQQKDIRMRLQELQHQQPLAHSSSTPLSMTTPTFADGENVYKRLSPQHFIEGPSTISTDSGSLLSNSTAARLVAAADEKTSSYGPSHSSNSNTGGKDIDPTKARFVGKSTGHQTLQSEHQHDLTGVCNSAPSSAATLLNASAAADEHHFRAQKQTPPTPTSTKTNDAESFAEATTDRSANSAAAGTVGAATTTKGQATQHLLDVAAVLMRKAMEETPDVEELARQLYNATQDLPPETVQQLLLTLASNGWGGGVGASPTEEEGEDEGEEEGEEEEEEEAEESGSRTGRAAESITHSGSLPQPSSFLV